MSTSLSSTEPTPTATDAGSTSEQIPSTSGGAAAAAAAAAASTTAADASTIAKAGNLDVAKSYPWPSAEYEEVVEDVDMFMQTLLELHRYLGTKFMVPTMGGKTLDLHRLFVEVTSRGGLEKVVSDRKWRDVIDVFCFPATITNASFVLRKYYLSLLHDYERVYYFRRHGSLTSEAVSVAKCPARGSASLHVQADAPASNEKGSSVIESPASRQLQVGCTVSGQIDGKFDNGYFVTFNVGSEVLRGVLYHVPDKLQVLRSPTTSIMTDRPNRKRSAKELKDPSCPKLKRGDYKFSFADNYPKLMSSYNEREKAISKEIEQLWSELTEDEKQSVNVIWSFTQGRAGSIQWLVQKIFKKVYREQGLKDKESYQSEMWAFNPLIGL